MGKTLKVAKDRAYDDTKSVIPREVGKGVHVDHAPSAQALKLMHLFVAKSGGAMAEDRWHEIRLSDIRAITGFRHHDTKSLEKLLREIRATVFSFDDPARKKIHIGGFMDHAEVDYREEERGNLTVRWYFAKMFRDLAEKSNHWAIMDRQTVFALRSKYSILLFHWLSNFTNLEHKISEVLSIEDVRAILGVPEGKLKTWDAMNRFALKPAIAELNQLSRHDVIATPLKRGRHIDAVKFEWEPKPDPTEVKRELDRPKAGRKTRRNGTAEVPALAFPASGGIRYAEPWQSIARDHGSGKDINLIGKDFRNWCAGKKIPLDGAKIAKQFETFCKGVSV